MRKGTRPHSHSTCRACRVGNNYAWTANYIGSRSCVRKKIGLRVPCRDVAQHYQHNGYFNQKG